ncbi:RpiR family transcriptional regulator [Secundilactobacillus silagincola]|uniref:RpiR family transcriptional regulator n=1 Tax=Secundilactobacillus silagincola TaxID=1714681 RepID=A0A1Z5J4F7_9LACO|nr:MurR/RpiR family transcriptional regulator [Secundilactobacillus silagincola]GAX08766.1 RpiR family transcriptional regulator [Secundilactobacillus silagincola]
MAQSAISSIRSYYPNLSKLHQKIADYIFAQPQMVSDLTINELAEKVGVSTASISRFAKAVGYSNFREFSLDLANVPSDVNHSSLFKKIDPNDTPKEMTEKTFQAMIDALISTRSLLHNDQLETISNHILKCHQLAFFGLGGSSVAALDGYHKFLRTSINSEYYPDFDVQLMQAAKMDENDCAIMISHSGENQQTLTVLKQLHNNHVPVIAITSYGRSSLAQRADMVMLSLADQMSTTSDSMYTLIAQLAMIDSLFTIVAVKLSNKTEAVMSRVKEAINQTRT